MSSPDPHVRTALVAGGGIGGLAAAIALGRAGWHVTVLEQAAVFWEAGAGLLITPNGERALDALGVGDAVRAGARRLRIAGVRASDGRAIVDLPNREGALHGLGVHRRVLHTVLMEAASAVAVLHPGARLLGCDPGDPRGRPARVTVLDAGDTRAFEADLLVGADGATSLVRDAVAPTARLEPSGFSSWRAVVADAILVGDDALVWWGPGAEFSVQRISEARVSWQAAFRRPDGVSFDDDLEQAHQLFAAWPAEVRAVLALTRPNEIVRYDLHELRGEVPSYVAGRAALLGDAAHAMLPALAQGANLALEDAVTLAHSLGGASLPRGLAAYDMVRRPRAQHVAARSRRAAEMGVGSALGTALGVLPDAWATRWYRGLYAWQSPA